MKLSDSDKQWIGWLITVLLIVASTWLGVRLPDLPPVPGAVSQGVTNLSDLELSGGLTGTGPNRLAIPTAQATATPGLVIDSSGIANPFEVRVAATPMFAIEDDGRFRFSASAASQLNMNGQPIVNLGNTGTDFVASTGGLNLAGDLDLAALLQLSFADLAVSDGDTITPTVTVYALDTTGAVTITLAASADEGQLLILLNDDANAVLINDTNLRSSDGNAITLAGAHDAGVFIYQDSEWWELLTIAGS